MGATDKQVRHPATTVTGRLIKMHVASLPIRGGAQCAPQHWDLEPEVGGWRLTSFCQGATGELQPAAKVLAQAPECGVISGQVRAGQSGDQAWKWWANPETGSLITCEEADLDCRSCSTCRGPPPVFGWCSASSVPVRGAGAGPLVGGKPETTDWGNWACWERHGRDCTSKLQQWFLYSQKSHWMHCDESGQCSTLHKTSGIRAGQGPITVALGRSVQLCFPVGEHGLHSTPGLHPTRPTLIGGRTCCRWPSAVCLPSGKTNPCACCFLLRRFTRFDVDTDTHLVI